MGALFRLPTSTSFNAEQALHAALAENLADVIIIGYDQEGIMFVCSSRMTCAEGAFLATKAHSWALNGGNGEDQ